MGQLKPIVPSNVLSLTVARVLKGGEPSPGEAKTNGYRPGDIEPPLPPTPERLELIRAYARNSQRRTAGPTASQIAQRFAPRASGDQSAGRPRPAAQAPLAPSLFALASGMRTLAAVLILVAVLPNLVLGAIFWLRLIDPPWSRQAAPQPEATQTSSVSSAVPSPVLTAPLLLEAMEGKAASLPIALDGTDGVPAGSTILVKGLPPGSALSSGQFEGESGWALRPDEIGDLHLVPPVGGSGQSKVIIQLVAPDARVIADTITVLNIGSEAKVDPGAPAVTAAPDDPQAAEGEELAGAAIEQAAASVDDTAAGSESVPLPTRRPDPPSAANAAGNWVKASAYVNLREGPSSTATVVSVVGKGAKLRVTARKRGWVQVTNPATAQSGWIYAGNVDTAR